MVNFYQVLSIIKLYKFKPKEIMALNVLGILRKSLIGTKVTLYNGIGQYCSEPTIYPLEYENSELVGEFEVVEVEVYMDYSGPDYSLLLSNGLKPTLNLEEI